MVFDKKLDMDFEFGSALQEREREREIWKYFLFSF